MAAAEDGTVSFTAACPCGVDAAWQVSLHGNPNQTPVYRIDCAGCDKAVQR